MANELLFKLQCDKLKDHVLVGFKGKEEISRPYEFELFFTVPVGTAVKDAIGASMADEDGGALHGIHRDLSSR